jgi:hypothetical protein
MASDSETDGDGVAERLRRAFPHAAFVRSDLDTRDLSLLPAASRAFLLDVGLPEVNFFEFDFGLLRTLPALDEYEAGREPPPGAGFDRVWCFAENGNQFFGIDAGRGGRAGWYDLGGSEPMFLNSGVEHFGAFLAECWAFVARRAAGADADAALRELVEWMAAIDPPGVDGWWSVVIQEFELGLS